jgi:hypothetical protein
LLDGALEFGKRAEDVKDQSGASRTTHACHTKIESTVRYLGIEVDDALAIAPNSTVAGAIPQDLGNPSITRQDASIPLLQLLSPPAAFPSPTAAAV